MPLGIEDRVGTIDLTDRFAFSTAVVASPVDAVEVIIGSVSVPGDISVISGVCVFAWAAYTVGTNGTAVNLRIRLTNVSGTVKAASGAVTAVAANLREDSVLAFDTTGVAGSVYKLTMTVTAATAGSTVSAVHLGAIAV